MSLPEFLMARISEDRRRASCAEPLGESAGDWYWLVDWKEGGTGTCPTDWVPARVLAECDAKRRLVSEFAVHQRDNFAECAEGWFVLAALASVYADHPDYRDEWRP